MASRICEIFHVSPNSIQPLFNLLRNNKFTSMFGKIFNFKTGFSWNYEFPMMNKSNENVFIVHAWIVTVAYVGQLFQPSFTSLLC